ncbi:MAG: chromosome segregation protein SMC [Ferrovum sp. 37-45-19]|nr:MAG: chromosome segregation protein SMC [Ferrovum sp. 21-44-67]OYV95227.1 MAG: chromosome segregation protein SMC [Ferrovum sp. 37-45-19]HQU05940.1 chromosome segregation protein SMC [Ferrovaceae bacterium]
MAGVKLHLKHIKLAGFKSFAEPTQIPVPGQLVGIVGPNGCGKSNVIDAVRWVLGESQAKQLRGETLQDVIFGGTTNRKPQGRASVELVFDNADGRAPGQWSQYAEISVRRVLARDGVSNYYINNTHVRRKDVQDVFMGTGLGPRAYAIIEQGMISRIVESKPEEIRVFLEEAAGISRYKERRRETELRLNDARGHLSRTADISRELDNQIGKLEGQAVVAEKYKGLQSELSNLQNLLLYARKRDAENTRQRALKELEKVQNELDERIANLRETEKRLELIRQEHHDTSDSVNVAQGHVFQANSDVSRIESELNVLRNEKKRLEAEIARLNQEINESKQRLHSDEQSLQQHQGELAKAKELTELAFARVRDAQTQLPQAEQQAKQARQALNMVREEQVKTESQLTKARSDYNAGMRLLQQYEERQQRLDKERISLTAPDLSELNRLRSEVREREVKLSILSVTVSSLDLRVKRCETLVRSANVVLQQHQKQIANIDAQLKALIGLQQKIATSTNANELVKAHGLDQLPLLWQLLDVKPDFETALEAVLKHRLRALEVKDFNPVIDWGENRLPLGFSLFKASARPYESAVIQNELWGTRLITAVTAKSQSLQGLLRQWLDDVYVVESLTEAILLMESLPQDVILVTVQGHCVTHSTVEFFAPQIEVHGAITRAREIEELLAEKERLLVVSVRVEKEALLAEETLVEVKNQLTQRSESLRYESNKLRNLEVESSRLQAEQLRFEQRQQQLQVELNEIAIKHAEENTLLNRYTADIKAFEDGLQGVKKQFFDLDAAAKNADQSLEMCRKALQAATGAERESTYLFKTAQSKIEMINHNHQAVIDSLRYKEPRLQELQQHLDTISIEQTEASLQQALQVREQVDITLKQARIDLDNCAALMRDTEENRLRLEQQLDPLREKLSDLRLKEQEARLGVEQAHLILAENNADETVLAAQLEKGVKTSTLQADITKVQKDIEALGPVNLAALVELESSRERKTYLDSQQADLQEAVETLENAMKKIDRDTREQLNATFNQVNESFSTLFPSLFAGGYARIEMTGDEILDAGIQIIAQPPGKKTTSIHLLSGGEKALTALALVFSLFQLNPAPFCILDEVDAPLDDANTERFVKLVTKMSEFTQFLFITHNKIAMEMAQQLVGITMAESGVSRMVAVDVDEAIRLTETLSV